MLHQRAGVDGERKLVERHGRRPQTDELLFLGGQHDRDPTRYMFFTPCRSRLAFLGRHQFHIADWAIAGTRTRIGRVHRAEKLGLPSARRLGFSLGRMFRFCTTANDKERQSQQRDLSSIAPVRATEDGCGSKRSAAVDRQPGKQIREVFMDLLFVRVGLTFPTRGRTD